MNFGAWTQRFGSWKEEALSDPEGDDGTRSVRIVTCTVAVFVIAAFIWASMFHIDELARGQGRLVPVGRVQPVQNQDGGVLVAMLVAEGSRVRAGDVLAELDDKTQRSDYEEPHRRWLQSIASLARIEAELASRPIAFPHSLEGEQRIRDDEIAAHRANRAELAAILAGYDEIAIQKREMLERARRELVLRQQEAAMLVKELEIVRPLVPAVLAETEVLRKERDLLNVRSSVVAQEHAMGELTSAIAQARADHAKALGDYRARLQKELVERRADADIYAPRSAARADKVARAKLLAPVDGVVKAVYFRRPGQVVPPAGVVLDLVPTDEVLMIEARILPSDVGFLRPHQRVRVKVSSFDFAIYGALDGTVRNISADSVQEKDGKEFYVAQVALEGVLKDKSGQPLPLVPGMQVNLDIVTGSRTVLTYLFKPIVRGLNQSFTER
ncbi:HlyD family type I secretion periplasmic adaptor subunit [Caenimonas aquaedulcis]|uniref:Membrane fusion protein (MFP) family protein n=1 Tax=Caenimonas aquaedulcis TaxID=2793270 RepID=A0A931H7I8_9BURK|nr:HlyD family type I secretion periplasmic adaptor subunit [Caenimonas aquaedulcis]MBG9390041.1 HlyD family type I secretion periplasmic adaptor subunit [Caenimonas aquaedulcis]